MEDEPKLLLGDHEGRRDNSELRTYVGELAMFNSFIIEIEENGAKTGLYKFFDDEAELAELTWFMFSHGFETHLNMKQVDDKTRQAHQMLIDQTIEAETIPDEIPEDWDGAA